MNFKLRPSLIFAGGFLFILDRVLKILAITFWNEPSFLFSWLGWLPHFNFGIAFGIKLPQIIIIVVSIIFFCFLVYWHGNTKNNFVKTGLIIVFLGALSNLIDRIMFGYTIDYFLLTISMFNLADILIIAGASICLFFEFAKKKPI